MLNPSPPRAVVFPIITRHKTEDQAYPGFLPMSIGTLVKKPFWCSHFGARDQPIFKMSITDAPKTKTGLN